MHPFSWVILQVTELHTFSQFTFTCANGLVKDCSHGAIATAIYLSQLIDYMGFSFVVAMSQIAFAHVTAFQF